MPLRPKLTEDSFLAHLFSPKKNALPTGIRKRPIVFAKGRAKARVASYNRMSAFTQELLRRSGLRESYLKGETGLRDAKEALRGKAVEKRIAKPLRVKNARRASRAAFRADLDTRMADRIRRTALSASKPFNLPRIIENVALMPENEIDDAVNVDYQTLKYKARNGSEYEIEMPDGTIRNPYWYH